MKRRRHLMARIDRLDPILIGGGVLFIDDLESGTVRLEDFPTRGGGYLLMPRPCQTAEEWAQKYADIHVAVKGTL